MKNNWGKFCDIFCITIILWNKSKLWEKDCDKESLIIYYIINPVGFIYLINDLINMNLLKYNFNYKQLLWNIK